MRKYVAIFVALVVAASILAGCAQNSTPRPKERGTLIVSHQDDPISFNPDWKTDDYAYPINQNIFNKLVTLDPKYNIIPDLATKWEVSPDGKTYTFYLAKNVKWHDGTKFTSQDVKWTFDTIIQKKGTAYNNLQAVESIECPDDYTVVFKLKQPYSAFLGFLAWYGTFVMPKHIYEGTDWTTNPANQKPIGTGPFKFVEWVKGDHVTLEKNPDYFKGAPHLDKVVFRIIPDANTALQAFLNNEVDVAGVRPPLSEVGKLEKTDGVKVIKFAAPSRYYIAFNMRKAPWNNLDVRKAIALAVNRQEIVDKALKGLGQAAKGFYTPAIAWAYNDKDVLPERNVQEANRLLDAAGLKPNAEGIRLKIDLPYFQGSEWADMATVIKANLKEVGIDVNLQQLEIAAWMQKVLTDHDFDITILNGLQGPDPDNLRLRVGSNGNLQMMGYNNAQVDKLLDEASQLTKVEERARKYKEIQRILSQELPIVPLAEVTSIYVFKSYVHGMPVEDGIGKVTFSNYSLVWLDKK